MAEDKQFYHNKGEQDAAAGHDSRSPHGVERLVTNFFTSTETKERQDAENEAYQTGYENAKNQKK